MESGPIKDHYRSGRGHFLVHLARTGWTIVVAVIAVVAGIATLNLIVTGSGKAVLNRHFAPWMACFTRLTRQG